MKNEDLLEAIKQTENIFCFNDDFFSLSLLYRVYVYEREQKDIINLNEKRYEFFFDSISYLDMYDS